MSKKALRTIYKPNEGTVAVDYVDESSGEQGSETLSVTDFEQEYGFNPANEMLRQFSLQEDPQLITEPDQLSNNIN
ncbi:hypothetical protein [Gracilimonas tropica]|uniref:hypothetical protein n=1 Tax=Gracilimonas tropica TaxID=454600 RepID=UPI00036242AF|nr:hypothetical protein [Gracilimonas tropica]